MQHIATQIAEDLEGKFPYMRIQAGDNITSSVTIKVSMQEKDKWANGIYMNSPFLTILLFPKGHKRWFEDKDEREVEMQVCAIGLKAPKCRNAKKIEWRKVSKKILDWKNKF